jgi:ribonuclease HI
MLIIYADGACKGNPGPGGWAYLCLDSAGNCLEACGHEAHTTNNKMELQAILRALSALTRPQPGEVRCYLDSKYVLEGMQSWVPRWIQKGWITTAGTFVKNRALWEALWEQNLALKPKWHHVKAHSGNPLNERVDTLASQVATGETPSCFTGPLETHPVESCRTMHL